MNKLNYIVLFYGILSFFSCNSKHNPPFDESFIQIISENQEFPSYAFALFFVQGENNKILLLDPRELKEIYDKGSFSMNYKKFIRKALNQQLIINSTDERHAFELNKDVTDVYLNNTFNDFLNIYCEHEDEKYILKDNIPKDQMTTVFYYAFINNYLTGFDDYIGRDCIISTSVYSNEKNNNKN
jgi:hypothetical protein